VLAIRGGLSTSGPFGNTGQPKLPSSCTGICNTRTHHFRRIYSAYPPNRSSNLYRQVSAEDGDALAPSAAITKSGAYRALALRASVTTIGLIAIQPRSKIPSSILILGNYEHMVAVRQSFDRLRRRRNLRRRWRALNDDEEERFWRLVVLMWYVDFLPGIASICSHPHS